MKKEHLLLIVSVSITALISLSLIKWIAPGLLGEKSKDLQLVQVDEKLPPFYEGVFRREDFAAKEYILKDPITRVRAKPMFPDYQGMGPNDILGFRNHNVPNQADIVAIGDSQTYGNNATLDNNWPSQLEKGLNDRKLRIYSMAVGGWGAVQYLDMFAKAAAFKPRAVIVAFYTGNDPLETFQLAYGAPHWKELIPDQNLSQADLPSVKFPTPENEWWSVEFKDGIKTVFTPTLRLASNQNIPAVDAGFDIMTDVARRITSMSKEVGIKVIFTVVPTKELSYAKKVKAENLNMPDAYGELISKESANIQKLANSIKAMEGASYVDILSPLQDAALKNIAMYPNDTNGHPVAEGYQVIASTLEQEINSLLPKPVNGLHAVEVGSENYQFSLVTDKGRWVFANTELIEANGWPVGEVNTLTLRDVSELDYLGMINEVNPNRFGPQKLSGKL